MTPTHLTHLLLVSAALLVGTFALPGCGDDERPADPVERVGEEIEDGVEDLGEDIDEATE